MSETIEIGPIRIDVDDKTVVCRFTDPAATMFEIPASLEEQLRSRVEERHGILEGKSVHIELGNLPAISSRQLGMILTIREVMKPYGPLQLHNVSTSVKHLLKLTGTERFFDFSEGAVSAEG